MARIRTIKPEFWSHEGLSLLPESTHMLAAALLNYADDEGYFNANPGLIKAACSPLREPSVNTLESLRSLQAEGYIVLGNGPDGRRYGRIVNFSDHQKISHPAKSKIAKLSITWDDLQNPQEILQSTPESLRPEQGTGNGERGTGNGERGTGNSGSLTLTGAAKKKSPAKLPKTSAIWDAYADAYRARYGTEPVRNAKVNAMLAQVVARIGADEAPHVAAWYVASNRSLYVSAKHCADLLVRDCEGLRTEWATKRSVTDTAARQADSKQTNLNVAETLIAELRSQHENR